MNKTILLIGLMVLIVALSGCLVDVKVDADVSPTGSGTAVVTIKSGTVIDKEVSAFFKDKDNVTIQKKQDKSETYEYTYTVQFSFNEVTNLSKNAKFITTDKGNSIVYEYTDLLNTESMMGSGGEVPDTEYCITLPGQIYEMFVNNIEETTYYGKSMACVEITNEEAKNGKQITIASEEKKKGCQYQNPPCGSNYSCINNQCVLKEGCAYNNPPCKENQNCIENQCNLKLGCDYSNPSCGEGFECKENKCEKTLGSVVLEIIFVVILIVVVGGVGYFIAKKFKK